MQAEIIKYLGTPPIFGIFLSIAVFLLGQWLFKISHGFFLFQPPLFVGMVLGIVILVLMAKWFNVDTTWFYTNAYLPGGNEIIWFLQPATIAFAIPPFTVETILLNVSGR